MSATRSLKTKREMIYRLLVENLDDPPERSPNHDVYPFQFGYELFTAGLVVGYLENEMWDGEYDGDGEYYNLVRFSQFADNNPGHLACVDLFEKLIRLENEGQQDEEDAEDEEATDSDEEAEETDSPSDESDGEDNESGDSEPSEISWNDIVAYADKGIGVLFAEWDETQKFDLQQYFSSVEHDVEDRLDIFEDLLTERSTTGSQGGVSF